MRKWMIGLCLLSGCATYQVCCLDELGPEYFPKNQEVEGLAVGCKELSKEDCIRYFDRNLLRMGYQPIQLTFQNDGEESVYFSSVGMSLPIVSGDLVASQVHTSTTGRVVGYWVGGLVTAPLVLAGLGMVPSLFFLSGAVDGIKSSNANQRLDADFEEKTIESFTIGPGECVQTVFFVPKSQFKSSFDLTLVKEQSNEVKTIGIYAIP